MAGKALVFALLQLWLSLPLNVHGQYSPHSLQAAIDALHRREILLNEDQNVPRNVEDFWRGGENEPAYRGNSRQDLNRALVDYLAREEELERGPSRFVPDFDENDDELGFEARKRSIFRERDELPYQSVFRERELSGFPQQPDLAEDFLEEMEREREEEREEKYRETLRRLWDKYQQQENDIEEELFDEDKKKRSSFDVEDVDKKKKKRQGGFVPMYWGPIPDKRRTFPVLPWLPASRKKRFPVAKRSTMPVLHDEANNSGTSEKVAKDLQVLFGEIDGGDKKKKRNSEDYVKAVEEKEDGHKIEKKSDHSHQEEDEDEPEDDQSEHQHEEEDDGGDFDEEDDDKKKKRAIAEKSSPEIVNEDQIIPGDLTDQKKKSVQWSKYFGVDKRSKKSLNLANGKYRSMMRERPEEDEIDRKKKQIDDHQIDSMDEKLKNIEDLIIDETVKYTGAHDGIADPKDVQKLKDHVISRLATAYSLEKMRKALENLKNTVDTERHLLENEIEPQDKNDDKAKRVTVKKEKAEIGHSSQAVEASQGGVKGSREEPLNSIRNHDDNNESDDGEKKKRTKKKKRNGEDDEDENEDLAQELGGGNFEPMHEGLMGRGKLLGLEQCPILDAMERRCRGVDILSGDNHQELLPICGVHQLCYLCGTSHTGCDLQYLSDADTICNRNMECQSAARSALMIMRGSPGSPQLGPKECARNPCLYNAIREIVY